MKNIGDSITVADFEGRDSIKNKIIEEMKSGENLSASDILEKIAPKIVEDIKEREDVDEKAQELEQGRSIS